MKRLTLLLAVTTIAATAMASSKDVFEAADAFQRLLEKAFSSVASAPALTPEDWKAKSLWLEIQALSRQAKIAAAFAAQSHRSRAPAAKKDLWDRFLEEVERVEEQTPRLLGRVRQEQSMVPEEQVRAAANRMLESLRHLRNEIVTASGKEPNEAPTAVTPPAAQEPRRP